MRNASVGARHGGGNRARANQHPMAANREHGRAAAAVAVAAVAARANHTKRPLAVRLGHGSSSSSSSGGASNSHCVGAFVTAVPPEQRQRLR
jgi:hypothetical protein